jgi:8-hydroxy-5-deazaflavin:NADPH oxidoreductase
MTPLDISKSKDQTVAILGNGGVGIALAKGFAGLGFQIVFGTRDLKGAKTRDALRAVAGSRAASPSEAARLGQLAVIALPWTGLRGGLEAAGAANLAGKLVIDVSNPVEVANGVPRLAVDSADSAGEIVQRMLPQAKVVKAFNIVTAGHMVNPHLPDGTPDMFIAGNDEAAKAQVRELLRAFGWRSAIDLGPIGASRLLESLAMIWITYAFRNDHWTHAFSLLGQKV